MTNQSSLRRARAAAVVVILSSILYSAPQFAEREAYEESVGCGDGTRWRTKKRTDVFGPAYYIVYKTICYVVFRAVGPLLVLLVLNTKLVLELKRRVRQRRRLGRGHTVADDDGLTSAVAAASALNTTRAMSRRRKLQRENITLMLVVVVFVFIVCQLPDLALRITASLVRALSC